MFDPSELTQLSEDVLANTKDLTNLIKKKCKKPGSRVFVCDDDVIDRGLACCMLKAHHYTTVEGSDGYDFMETLRKNDIGLLITDLTMPGMDGMEIIRVLEDSHVPVIAVTGLPMDAPVVIEALERKITVMQKPLDEKELIHQVKIHFGLPAQLNAC